jgi:Toxin with a conserved tryptophan and TIP tripeptide motif
MAGPIISGMEGNKLKRTIERCTGNLCECLSDAIEALLNANNPHGTGEKGLRQHVAEQVAKGASGPGTTSWNVHEKNIADQQRNMRDHLREHEARGCGGPPAGGSPVPAGAWRAATAPLPTAADWGANNPAAYEGLTGSKLGDAAVGVGVGYGIYRFVRFLPSLVPVLWPSIPANLAIP